jgi:nitrogen fixation protein FixH
LRIVPRIPLCAALILTLASLPACTHKPDDQPNGQASAVMSPASGDAVNGWHIALKVTPDKPSMTKPIIFLLHVTDAHDQPVNDAEVNGSLTMKSMDMGTVALKFAPEGAGDYEATIPGVDMSGPWNLAVEASRGSTHVKTNLDVTVYD